MVRNAGGSRTHFQTALQAVAVPSGSSVYRLMRSSSSGGHTPPKRPRQESNLAYDLRGVACCIRHTPRTFPQQCPADESNAVLQFRRLPCCPAHSQGAITASRPGVEPGPGPSEGPMRSVTPSGLNNKGPTTGFAPASRGLQDRCLAIRPRRLSRRRCRRFLGLGLSDRGNRQRRFGATQGRSARI
jgi:hypothetical protein